MADMVKATCVRNTKFEVLTPNGFKPFKGVLRGKNRNKLVITTDKSSIICTPKHKLKAPFGKVYAGDLEIGDNLLGHTIQNIQRFESDDDVFELLHVDGDHSYIANGFVSYQCLIIDEMAHIPNHLMEEFWASVIPVISSTRKRSTKIFAVSTPCGTGNKFHEIFTRAISGEDLEWKAEQINWWDVPGRGKKWKADVISSLGGDLEVFEQEFNCVFLERGESAVDGELLDELRSLCKDPVAVFEDSHYRIWEPPQDGHIYGIGVDVSEGIGRAASVAQVLDFTDLTNIRQAACYHSTTVHPLRFAETLSRIGTHWGRPPMLIERNNCGAEVINALNETHGYHNLVSYSPPTLKTRQELLGVMSHTNVKYSGVMNMRYWINTLRSMKVQDISLVKELQTFVRYPNGTWRAKQGNIFDDRVMALVWALFLLDPDICQRYYEIVNTDDTGKPLRLEKYTVDKNQLFSLDSFYQNNEGAPLPAIIGISPNSGVSTGLHDMINTGWSPAFV